MKTSAPSSTTVAFLVLLASTLLLGNSTAVADTTDAKWAAILEKAKGQDVYFHAWGGEQRINAYIDWAAERMEELYGVHVHHVKVQDTGLVVSQIVSEKTAGREDHGSVDLVWINGENFARLKADGLLAAPGWAEQLPNWQLVDVANKPTVRSDFTIPTDGQESPWGMAQLVFFYDSARLSAPPRSMADLASYATQHPGRVTYPRLPDFLGTTFIKQALVSLIDDPTKLQTPVNEATFNEDVAPLLAYFDQLQPNLWRQGRAFPASGTQMQQLLADGEIDIGFSFNPAAASSAIANGEMPDTVRSYVLDGGTLGNTHFVAVPFNSSAKEGAMVLANFLLSPEAQLKKQNPAIWGDPTVLDTSALSADYKAKFDALDLGAAGLTPSELGQVLPEPHPSWVEQIEALWTKRYGGS